MNPLWSLRNSYGLFATLRHTSVCLARLFLMYGYLEQIYGLVMISLVVASISWTVTQEEIFREWRELCEAKSKSCEWTLQRKFFYVFTCEYCFSHWVTLLLLIITGFRMLIDDWRGYVIAFFVIDWIANQWMSLYRRLRVEIKHENVAAEKIKEEKKAIATYVPLEEPRQGS
jgi:hypothetical protein